MLDDGWWSVGKGLGLIVCGVDEKTRKVLDGGHVRFWKDMTSSGKMIWNGNEYVLDE